MQPHQPDPIDEIDVELPTSAPSTRRGRRPIPGGRSRKRLLIIAGIAASVFIIAGVVYWLVWYSESSEKPDGAAVSQSNSNEAARGPQLSEAEAAEPVTFKSTALNLELTHRKDWTLKESTDKTEIVLTSPSTGYLAKADDTTETEDVFTLKIRSGVTDAMDNTLSSAKAVKDSEVIAYAAPTEAQRHYTNVSFVGKTAEAFNFMLVTGSLAFKPGESVGNMLTFGDGTLLIAGGYGTDPDGALAFESASKAHFDQTNAYKQAKAIIESLKVY